MYSGIFLSKETFENDGDAIRDFVIDRSIDRSIRREISMHRTLNARTSLPVLADFSFSFGDDEKGKHPSSSSSSLLLLFGWRAGIFCQTLVENTGHTTPVVEREVASENDARNENARNGRYIYILVWSKISSYFYASTGTIRERSIVSHDRNKYRNSLAGGGIIIDP